MTRLGWYLLLDFRQGVNIDCPLDRLFESLVRFLEDVSRRTTVTMVGFSRGIQSLLESYAEPC